MDWHYYARLRWKLLSGFGAVVVLMIAVGIVGLVNMQQQDERLDEMYEKHTLGLGAIMRANVDLVASGRDEKSPILAEDRADVEKYAPSSRKLLSATIDHVARFEHAFVLAETRQASMVMQRDLTEVQAGRDRVLQLALDGKDAEKVEELGKLGEQIGAAIETIDDIAVQIHKVQAGTINAVAAMEQGTAKVDQGAARADEAGRALGEILRAVEVTVGHVNQIASAAQEMAGGAQDVVQVMGTIRGELGGNRRDGGSGRAGDGVYRLHRGHLRGEQPASEEASASAEEMSVQTEELAATADQLCALVARIRLEAAAGAGRAVVARRRAVDWGSDGTPAAARRAS